MARQRRTSKALNETIAEHPPALTPEAQEAHMIALAVGEAERQIREGTASSQIITHYLRLAAMKERERLEIEKLQEENKLLRAKTEAIETAKDSIELYQKAIDAMKIYQGVRDD